MVKAKNQSEMKFIADLLNKLGVQTSVLDKKDLEDLVLANLMKQADRTKKVSRDTILKKLKAE